MRWVAVGSDVKLLADQNGDGIADIEITLSGISSISVSDLVV